MRLALLLALFASSLSHSAQGGTAPSPQGGDRTTAPLAAPVVSSKEWMMRRSPVKEEEFTGDVRYWTYSRFVRADWALYRHDDETWAARGNIRAEHTLPRGRGVCEVFGEKAVFDAKNKEILGGVLAETGPIDMSPDRFARKFARLRYTGQGIMVRSDQRGESPRSAEVWGQKLTATVVWGSKTCKLSPADIWQQAPQEGGGNGR